MSVISELDLPHQFIAVFYRGTSKENSVLNNGNISEDIKAKTASDLIQKCEKDFNPFNLLNPSIVQPLQCSSELAQYFCSLICAASAMSKIRADHFRRPVFNQSMIHLKEGNFSDERAQELLEVLIANQHHIGVDNIKDFVDKVVLHDFKRKKPTPECLRGLDRSLELVLKISQRDPFIRSSVFTSLLEMAWSCECVCMLAVTVVDMVESEAEAERVLEKLARHAHWKPVAPTLDTATAAGNSFPERQLAVEHDELPALLYQVTRLSHKCNSSSQYLKQIVVDSLANSLDCIVFQANITRTPYSSARAASLRAGDSSDDSRRADAEQQRASAVIATIVHHLSLLVAKDQGIASEIVNCVKDRRLLQSSKRHHSKSRKISEAKLLLCMLAAKAPHQQSRMISSLSEITLELFANQEKASSSHWLRPDVWQGAACHRPLLLRQAFERLITGPLMIESVAGPLIGLALSLIDLQRPHHRSQWESLTGSLVFCQAAPPKQEHGPNFLGAWLIVKLFLQCDFARVQIVRDVILRLVIGASAATGSGPLPHANSTASLCVSILAQLVHECPHALWKLGSELQEVFSVLPELHPVDASRLINSLSPLFSNCPMLADRCAMSLRKTTFSRDTSCRQSAVAALVALMRSQLKQLERQHGRRDGGPFEQGPGHQAGLSFDEILSLLRRFCSYQAPIRGLLYQELYKLQKEWVVVRASVLKLLVGHLKTLLTEKRMHRAIEIKGREQFILSLESCLDANHQPTERVSDLLLTILAIAKDSLNEGRRPRHTQVNHPADRGSPAAFLQHEGMSDIDDIPLSQSREENSAAGDAISVLWSVALNTSHASLLTDYNLGELEDVSERDEARQSLLMEILRALSVVTMALPNVESKVRLDNMKRLSSLSAELVDILARQAKSGGKSKRPKKEDAERERADREMEGNADGDTLGKRKQAPPSTKHSHPDHSLHSPNLHLILGDIEFASTTLLLVSEQDEGGHSQEEAYAGLIDLSADESAGIARLVFEKCLIALESVLGAMIHEQSQPCPIIKSTKPSAHMHCAVEEAAYRIEMLERIFEEVCQLLHRMLAFLSFNSYDELSCSKFEAHGPLPSLSFVQLMFRGILGCLRVHVAALHLEDTALAIKQQIIDRESASTSTIARTAAAAFATQSAFSHHASQLCMTKAINTAFSKLRTSKKSVDLGLEAFKGLFMMIVKKQIPAVAPKATAGERLERQQCVIKLLSTPTLVCILGELLAVYRMSSAERDAITDSFIKDCKSNLHLPRPQITQALIEFLVFASPASCEKRLSRTAGVAKLIAACLEAAPISQEENSDAEEKGSPECFTILNFSTLPTAISALLAIVDKAATEIDSLLKLKDKVFTAKKGKASVRGGTADGHISSEEESDGLLYSDDDDDDDDCSKRYGSNSYGTAELLVEETGTALQPIDPNDIFATAHGPARRMTSFDIDIEMCDTLRALISVLAAVIKPQRALPGDRSERLMVLFTKLFRLEVKVAKILVLQQVRHLPRAFKQLAERTAEAAFTIEDFLIVIQNSPSAPKPKKRKNVEKEEKDRDHDNAVRSTKHAKIIPDLIYQMEQLDLQLIKLSNLCKDVASGGFAKMLRRNQMRDFKVERE